jgi:TonB family protein
MQTNRRRPTVWVRALLVGLLSLVAVRILPGQEGRKLITQELPAYPDLARRIRLSGVVKVEVVIGADGLIKETKVIGGHPLFIDSTMDALKRWRYTPAKSETTTTLEFNFHP